MAKGTSPKKATQKSALRQVNKFQQDPPALTAKVYLDLPHGKVFTFTYSTDVSQNSRNHFKELLNEEQRKTAFVKGLKNFVDWKSKHKTDNVILFFKWNLDGLTQRVPTARSAGLRTPAGDLVNSAVDMRNAIVSLLCSGASAGLDLGGHHDLIQFLPGCRRRSIQMEALMAGHSYLRHHALGYTGLSAAAAAAASTWPDIVDSLQILTLTAAGRAAVGPVDLLTYFNT